MKIEKLPSGSYRIRKMYHGKSYTVITDYKPTQKEAIQLLAAELDSANDILPAGGTFLSYAQKYIAAKEAVLSPSTTRSYRGILRNLSDWFLNLRLSDITADDVQKEISLYAAPHGPSNSVRSPKTIRNAHGLIASVLGMYRPSFVLRTTLPQAEKQYVYEPTDDDVARILSYAKGSRYEIALHLAVYGMRRSEICALLASDLDGNTLTIDKALVLNDQNEYVIKNTKTTDGTRRIYVSDYVADLIRSTGFIYRGDPHSINEYLHRAQDRLGIERFSLHKLRHYYASMSHSLGIPDAYIMESGGWKSDAVLKKVYRKAQQDKAAEMQRFASDYISQLTSRS
jgi:integrase